MIRHPRFAIAILSEPFHGILTIDDRSQRHVQSSALARIVMTSGSTV
ncbi:hypothetical protein C7S13_4035 [Burkholderia cepacia]|nr:hypothetical protein [Burkholderia cepacia]